MTPVQCKMARAAANMSMTELSKRIGLSAMAISRYENNDYSVISVATLKRIEDYFNSIRIYFGQKNGVCVGSDIFAENKQVIDGMCKAIARHGIQFDSKDVTGVV